MVSTDKNAVKDISPLSQSNSEQPSHLEAEGWEQVTSKREKRQKRQKQLHQLTVIPNPSYDGAKSHKEKPFLRQNQPPKVVSNSRPPTAPPPKQNAWWPCQKVFVYQDSNGRRNKDQVEKELQKIKMQQDIKLNYNIEYCDTYTLPRTFYEMRKRDHTDAVVLINIGTNDIRLRQENPHNFRSKQDPQILMQRMISFLKSQTKSPNIVIVASAPSTKFNMEHYNKANHHLCRKEGVGFAHTLVTFSKKDTLSLFIDI